MILSLAACGGSSAPADGGSDGYVVGICQLVQHVALDAASQGFKDALKVLGLSDRIVEENKLTTMMITHNMSDAIKHGNRLIMMNQGRIVFDISGEAASDKA